MSKLKFKPADFITLDYGNAIPAAIVANTKLDEHLASCPVVYGYIGEHGSSWSSHKPGTFIQENITHTARLVNVEPIECQHKRTQIWEPHLAGARKCLDCGFEYNPNRSPAWQAEPCKHEPEEQAFLSVATDGELLSLNRVELTKLFSTYRKCKHCGVELKAKWEPK